MPTGDFAPGLDDIERLAREALARIPEPFASHLPDIILQVEDWPSREQLDDMGIADPYELTGLYEGRPVGDKSVEDFAVLPDRILLFRRPLLDEWGKQAWDSLISSTMWLSTRLAITSDLAMSRWKLSSRQWTKPAASLS